MPKRGLLAVVLLLLSVPGIATLAGGQLPTQGSCQLTLEASEANPGARGFEAEESRAFTYVISNPSQVVDARGELQIQRDPPPNWHWSTATRTITVPAGETNESTIRITYLGGGGPDAELAVQVTDVRCSTGGFSSPSEGQPSEALGMVLTHAATPPGQADDGLPWAWIVFGVIVAGTVVGVPLVYRGRGARIEASVEESEKDVIAGRGTSFPVTLKNLSKDPVPVKLEVAEVQEGWSALTTLPDLEMGPRETRTVYMMVRAPAEAKPGDLCVAKLNVKPEGGSATTVKTLTRVDAEGAGEAEASDEAEPDEEA